MRNQEPVRIPPLKDLLYKECGYQVPADFTLSFVILHGQDWVLAERDWERIVAAVLNTDAVDPGANGGRAIKQAVEATAALLSVDRKLRWCPICMRKAIREGEEDPWTLIPPGP